MGNVAFYFAFLGLFSDVMPYRLTAIVFGGNGMSSISLFDVFFFAFLEI